MSRCKDCGAEVAYLQRLGVGAAVACEPRTVRDGDTIFVNALHEEHRCAAAPVDPRQRSLFGEDIITSSRLRVFRRCRREHHLRYVLGRTTQSTAAQDFGSLVHVGLEAWWQVTGYGFNAEERMERVGEAMRAHAGPDADPFELARAEALLAGYEGRYGGEVAGYTVLGVEQEFRATLPALPFEAPVRLGGKLDAVVRTADGRVLIVEHKTSSEDISTGAAYWARLRLDGQVSLYYLGAEALGYEVSGVLYDVLGKPGAKPLRATAAPRLRKDGQPYAGQRLADETPDEYRARIVEALAADPDRYFQRLEVVRLEGERARHLEELRAEVRELQAAAPLPNPDACTRYGSTCAFMPLCCNERTLDEYTRLEWPHPELTEDK